MGREKEYRQRLTYLVESARKKTLENQIAGVLSDELGLSETESRLLSVRMSKYIRANSCSRGPNQIIVEVPCEYGRRRPETKKVKFTPFDIEDLELESEFGIAMMQLGRTLRLIEEAYAQGGIVSGKLLSLICNITPTSLRERISRLRKSGILVPISGISCKGRKGILRSTWAMTRFYEGMPPSNIRREVAMTKQRLRETMERFDSIISTREFNLDDPEEAEWSTISCKRNQLNSYECPANPVFSSWDDFREELITEFGFSPIKVRALKNLIEEIEAKLVINRTDGEVIYWAVSATEPAGKPLIECRLVPCRIEFFLPGDIPSGEPNKLSDLKIQKALRYSVQAKQAGGYLSYADLSYLLGIHTEAIRKLIEKNKGVVPLRGSECDIGRGVTHRKTIIELYLQMYTETEIASRTGHSYESIENYIRDFAIVKTLSDKGMPVPLIRRVTGRSIKLIHTYLELLQEYSKPEYAFRLHHLTKVFEAHQGKKGGVMV